MYAEAAAKASQDALQGREAQAAPGLLCGEKGSEDASLGGLIHAAARGPCP